jgi:uncharacterized protein (TIGR04255 family)
MLVGAQPDGKSAAVDGSGIGRLGSRRWRRKNRGGTPSHGAERIHALLANKVHANSTPREGVVGDSAPASPKFRKPPVVEVVMGVQFEPLKGFGDPHAGLFWATHLGKDSWPKVRVAPHLPSSFERFGSEEQWGAVPPFEIRPGDEPSRTQFLNAGEDRMVQVQNTRFHYNWVKKNAEYPSYDALLPEFRKEIARFRAFSSKEGLGEVKPNQWEITYVNHVPAGSLWSPGDDWSTLFPWLKAPASKLVAFDTVTATWRLVIGDSQGRLHIKLARARHPDKGDLMILDLTARGSAEHQESLEDGLSLGHDAIVFSFAEMTSKRAHQEWGRYQ